MIFVQLQAPLSLSTHTDLHCKCVGGRAGGLGALPQKMFGLNGVKSCWVEVGLNWLFNVTINDISVIYVTAHRRIRLDLRSGSHAIDIS